MEWYFNVVILLHVELVPDGILDNAIMNYPEEAFLNQFRIQDVSNVFWGFYRDRDSELASETKA